MKFIIKLLLVFTAYFLAGKLGLSFEPLAGFASLVWPPTGIALAAMLLFRISISKAKSTTDLSVGELLSAKNL